MVFTSVTFLFYFLPLVFLVYFVVPKKQREARNLVLLLFSLFFYFAGEPKAILVMLVSIVTNYATGYMIGITLGKKRIFPLVIAIVINLSMLFYYKYLNFFTANLANLFNLSIKTKEIIMPIGISFFTFQGLSYVFDVYMGNAKYKKNPLDIALYISLFPQLIAGPIVRYETVANEIEERDETLDKFASGVLRFIVGFSKKLLLANKFGIITEEIFRLNGAYNISIQLAWFGAFAYAMQIYYDFSAYSDMAIGLGKIFGFNFLENFNYPYISKSITEFWRRWHISLGTWFRDYIYIPLGGNRVSVFHHIINIFIVWFLTGFWHGASWNYIIWGLYFFVFLVLEKYIFNKAFKNIPNIFKHIYTVFVLLIGWVIFKEENNFLLLKYLRAMFNFGSNETIGGLLYYLKEYYIEIILGIVFSTGLFKKFELGYKKLYLIFVYGILFILSIIVLFSSSYNPFIYFRF